MRAALLPPSCKISGLKTAPLPRRNHLQRGPLERSVFLLMVHPATFPITICAIGVSEARFPNQESDEQAVVVRHAWSGFCVWIFPAPSAPVGLPDDVQRCKSMPR